MPKSGTATYKTVLSASALELRVLPPQTARAVTGTATVKANFGTGVFDTTLDLSEGKFFGTSQIQNDFLNGDIFTSGENKLVGSFLGRFYGPAAAEVGYTFAISILLDPYSGASMPMLPPPYTLSISGVVVGKKE